MGIFEEFANDIKKEFKKKKINIGYGETTSRKPIPTGSVVIDSAFDGGLFFKGVLSEIASFESGGKTTISLSTLGQALESEPDKSVMFFDFEYSFDSEYAKKLGVDVDDERVIVFQPSCIEDMDKILVKAFGKNGKLKGRVSAIVVDSVAAARPQSSIDEEIGSSSQKSQHASAWSIMSPKLAKIARDEDCAVILVNQFRSKPPIGNTQYSLSNVGIGQGYSNVDTNIQTTGGNSLRYFLSVRYVTKFRTHIKEPSVDPVTGEVIESKVANKFSITCVKNKLNDNLFKTADYCIKYGVGLYDFPIIFDFLVKHGVITNRGSHMIYKSSSGEEIKVLGKSKFKELLYNEHYDDMVSQYVSLLKDRKESFSSSNKEDIIL